MKPVIQTIFSKEDGNCWAACVASILEISIEKVPNFASEAEKMNPRRQGEWFYRTREWLEQYGHTMIYVAAQKEDKEANFGLDVLPNLPVIASGKSPRLDCLHAIIMQMKMKKTQCGLVADELEMVHDPHPSGSGLVGEVLDYCIIVRLPLALGDAIAK